MAPVVVKFGALAPTGSAAWAGRVRAKAAGATNRILRITMPPWTAASSPTACRGQGLSSRLRGGAPMTPFEFIFPLFGLLIGLSYAEILGGLARALKAPGDVRIGWCAPRARGWLLC